MELATVKGVISVTLSVDSLEKQRLLGLSPNDLLQLSTEKLATIVLPTLIRDAVVDYNGDTVQIIFSI